TELIADLLRVVVLLAADRVTAPAHDEARVRLRREHAGVAQDMKDRVGDPRRRAQIESVARDDVFVNVQEVAHHREQVLADAADHPAVDESAVRRVLELERDAADVLDDGDAEIAVAAQDLTDVVVLGAGIQHRERALTPKLVKPAAARSAKLTDLRPRKNLQFALRRYRRVHRPGAPFPPPVPQRERL